MSLLEMNLGIISLCSSLPPELASLAGGLLDADPVSAPFLGLWTAECGKQQVLG